MLERRNILLLVCLALAAVFASGVSHARDVSETVETQRAFASVPVLHEGRIKPLESFAKAELEKLSGGRVKIKAMRWLAESLFRPHHAAKLKVIAIPHSDLRSRLDVIERKSGLYSLEEITPGLKATQGLVMDLMALDKDSLTKEQRALLSTHENALQYGQILQSLSLFLPLDVALPDSLDITPSFSGQPTYMDISKRQDALVARARDLVQNKGRGTSGYTPEDNAIAKLAFEYDQLTKAGEDNVLFRVIPSGADSSVWLSPWSLVVSGQAQAMHRPLLQGWQDLARAYRQGENREFQSAAQSMTTRVFAHAQDRSLARRVKAEQFYNAISPLKAAAGLYLVFLALGSYALVGRSRLLHAAAVILALAGVMLHASGIGMRIYILERPPVGSLYESLLFVSLIVMLVAFYMRIFLREKPVLLAGAFATVCVLLISPAVAPAGDNLEVLDAVLNTNFWLSTHVICMTIGYGLCILTAMLAHVALFVQGRNGTAGTGNALRHIYILSLASLFFTAFGTVLGGIWADQSWGRFWGWDPKENGALLIVLWLIWLQHGRHSGHVNQSSFLAGLAYLNVIVALAWFGVNLLGVGLHSYGFTSGLMVGLFAFILIETLLTAGLYYYAVQKTRFP